MFKRKTLAIKAFNSIASLHQWHRVDTFNERGPSESQSQKAAPD